jgi:hypothetical protein
MTCSNLVESTQLPTQLTTKQGLKKYDDLPSDTKEHNLGHHPGQMTKGTTMELESLAVPPRGNNAKNAEKVAN